MSSLPLLAMRMLGRPQMLLPEKMAVILTLLEGRIGLDAANISALAGAMPAISRPQIGSKTNPDYTVIAGVAVIGVVGTLVARGDIVTNSSGVLSYKRLQSQVRRALNDDAITAILLDIDSPGGEAVGAFEVSDYIRKAASKKPIVASVAGLCCSAAYAIAASTNKIMSTKSSLIGSVGVVAVHLDKSRKLEADGLSPTRG